MATTEKQEEVLALRELNTLLKQNASIQRNFLEAIQLMNTNFIRIEGKLDQCLTKITK